IECVLTYSRALASRALPFGTSRCGSTSCFGSYVFPPTTLTLYSYVWLYAAPVFMVSSPDCAGELALSSGADTAYGGRWSKTFSASSPSFFGLIVIVRWAPHVLMTSHTNLSPRR